MSALRVLVTGAAGQVGVDLVSTLRGEFPPGADPSWQPDGVAVGSDEFEVLALARREFDITNREAVRNALSLARPDVVVNLAAYTAVDRAEQDIEACYAVNADATGLLSESCATLGVHFVTVSTDYVFDGQKGAGYVEDDPPNPQSVYGASKWAGEQQCRAQDTIVRTSWVMGVRGQSVVHVIAERAANGSTVRFVDDQTGTVTLAADLARALVTIVRERPGGVWHVANEGTTTWFEVARFVGHEMGRDDSFATPISTAALSPQPLATRPARSDLDTTKWRSRWSALPDWRDGVARLLRDRTSS